jgi:hypothetical protein
MMRPFWAAVLDSIERDCNAMATWEVAGAAAAAASMEGVLCEEYPGQSPSRIGFLLAIIVVIFVIGGGRRRRRRRRRRRMRWLRRRRIAVLHRRWRWRWQWQ